MFYHAMLGRARYCYCKSSVCLSVRPSVRDDEVSWSHKLESFDNNFTVFALRRPNIIDLFKRKYPKFWLE